MGTPDPKLEDAIERLTAMVGDRGETWDLSPNDREAIKLVLERCGAAIEGEPDDYSPGDVIAAYPDGTIVLDDGITTHNRQRAKDFLAGRATRAERVLEAALDESPNPICPRCMGTGKYQRFPTEPQKDCAICNGTGRIAEEAPLPTAREHAAFTMHCPKCGIDVFAHGETCPQPVSEARLRELVAKWRKEVEHASSEFEEGEQYGTNQCAAELERALESA